jgi:hypothetical protein
VFLMEEIKIQQLEGEEEWLVKKKHIYFLICSLILGLLFNLLFFGKPLGLSYPLYVLALYTVLFWNMRQNQQVKLDGTWLLGIPIIALSCSYFIFSNQLFAALNFVMIPILFVAHTLLLTSNNRFKWFEFQFLVDILQGVCVRPLVNCLEPFYLISKIAKPRANPGKFRVVGKVLAGLLLAIPLLIVIVPLLASADDVFRNFVELIPNIFQAININELVARVLIVTIVACLVFSYLWSLFVSKLLTDEFSNTDSLNKPGPFLDPITVTTILVLIDALYIFFIAIQFSYLFGSLQSGLPDNFTYAEYARKGFFELVVVTLINLVILLGNINFVKESGSMLGKVVKVLNTALVVSTIIMLLSAHFRMFLYEEAYGFTYLRVLTHAFMGYLFVLFVVTLTKIWHQALPLLKSYIVISIVAYSLVNYINIDSLIVKNNIERYNKGNPIDIMYLTKLSYDAVPQLVDFMNSTSNQGLAKQLENELKYKKQVLERATPWQSFNISKYRARLAWFK